jgi:hypothetical protein
VTKINYLVMVLLFVVPVMAATYLLNLLYNWLHLSQGYSSPHADKSSRGAPSSSSSSSSACS